MSSSQELTTTVGAQTASATDTPAPWTRLELQAALRRAGWVRMAGPAACYVSPSGTRFHLDRYQQGVGVVWRWYAARRTLPGEGQ